MLLPKERSYLLLAGSIALLAAAATDGAFEGRFAIAYAIPVIMLGFAGWGWGLAAAIVASIAHFASDPRAQSAIECALLVVSGIIASFLSMQERRRAAEYRGAVQRLADRYEQVQLNFEGLKRAERLSAIGHLSAGLAHEIRNPLASISGAAAILQRNQELDPKNVKCVEIINKECQRLNTLLTSFLDFAGPRPPRFQMVSVEHVIDNVLAVASHGVRGKVVRCDKRIEPGVPLVECDPEQLEQVLLNLVINAIDASPDGESVTVSAGPAEDGKVAVRVVDRGYGVAPAHVDRLFDPFFTTKEHGTGLGLPIAHQIVTQMRGSLIPERNQDRGMTFSVVLPRGGRT